MSSRFLKKWKKPSLINGKLSKYYFIVKGIKNFKMGKNTDIGAFTYIQAQEGVILEDEVQIGSHCSIYSVSTIDDKSGPVLLKKNCRLGTHSTVMPGVTIGENSVIGAYSFVNKSIPDNVMAYGIPIKVIKKI
jgi:acetyltransferase-like isoleucine patch superfamily enzyme